MASMAAAVAQGGVLQAHGDAGLGLGALDVAHQLAAAVARLLHPVDQHELVRDDGVEPAVEQIGDRLFLGRVELRLGAGLGVDVLGVVGLGGRGLGTDRLAGKRGRLGRGDIGVLQGDQRKRRGVVFVGEGDLLLAFLGDAHRGDDGVEFLGLQGRNDAIPILGDDLAFDLHLRAERIGDVDVEAFHLAVRRDGVEGRIGALGADLDLFGRVYRTDAERQHGGGRSRQDPSGYLHFHPLGFSCYMLRRSQARRARPGKHSLAISARRENAWRASAPAPDSWNPARCHRAPAAASAYARRRGGLRSGRGRG